jgi:hypothetical protein
MPHCQLWYRLSMSIGLPADDAWTFLIDHKPQSLPLQGALKQKI